MDGDAALGRLPFPLAYVWRDLERLAEVAGDSERDAVVGLYHLLDAVEVCAKFLAALAVAEAETGGVEFSVPERAWLGERPALGTWLAVLDYVDKEMAKGPGPAVVPRLHEVVAALGQAASALVVPPEVPAKDLRSLRNWVAHGGVPSAAVAAEILAAGRDALEVFMVAAAGVFAGVSLVHVDAEGAAAEVNFEAESSFHASALGGAEPGLYVGAGEHWLQIWPLVRHAQAGKGGHDVGRQLVTQVFVRLQAGVAEYATLDERSVAGWGRPEAVAYRRRFTDAAQTQAGFWAEAHEAAAALVGRHGELARVRAALGGGRGGGARRLWLSGPMGQGKSALAAKASVEAQGRGEVVIAHFFRSADPRCSLRAFVGLALETLDPESAVGDLKKDSARLRTLLTERAPLVVCDGLDELERATSTQEVEDLLALSRVGGTWLFGGRPNLDALANRAGLTPLFEDGLGPMGTMDLRALVVSQVPPAVRDAIVRHDTSNEEGELENPYVAALAERAEGLPLYVVLMLEWLASFRSVAEVKGHIVAALEDPRQVLPAGLDALYAQLVDGWGLGTLATVKTFLLCLLCAAAEPVDAQSIAALCFGDGGFLRAPTSEEERTADVALCDEVLSLFAPVLRLVNDADGRLGWRIFHDSFRGFLADPANEAVAPVFASARQSLARFGADPERSAHEPLRRHLYRHGITYLRAEGDQAQADALLSDFDYLYRRLECLKVQGVEGLLGDLEHSEDPLVTPWFSFVRSRAHFLRRQVTGWGPHQSLHQLAYDSAIPEITSSAKDWSDGHHRPALYRIAGAEPFGAGPIVLESHGGSVHGALELRDGRILSWSEDRTLRLWDPDTGAELGPPLEGHTDMVRAVLELRDGRILMCSLDHTLRLWDPDTGATLGPPLEGHTEGVRGAVWSCTMAGSCRGRWTTRSGSGTPTPARRSVRRSRATPTGWPARVGIARRPDHVVVAGPHASTVGPRLRRGARPPPQGPHRLGLRRASGLRDGRILSWSEDRTLRQWDPDTGVAIGPPLEGHTGWLTGATELRDGRILSCSLDATLRLWDPDTGAELGSPLEGHTSAVSGLVELRDGRILSWSHDHTLRLWDPDTGAELGPPLEGHTDLVSSALSCATAGSCRGRGTTRSGSGTPTLLGRGPATRVPHRSGARHLGAARRPDLVVVGGSHAPPLGSRHRRGARSATRGPHQQSIWRAGAARRPDSVVVLRPYAPPLGPRHRRGTGPAARGPHRSGARRTGAARRPNPVMLVGRHAPTMGPPHRCRGRFSLRGSHRLGIPRAGAARWPDPVVLGRQDAPAMGPRHRCGDRSFPEGPH